MRHPGHGDYAWRFAAQARQLPAEQRMKLGWLLIGGMHLVSALQVPRMDLVLRAIRAAVRQGNDRPRTMLRAASSPALGVATGLVLAQRIGHPFLLRAFYRRVSNNQR